MKTDFKSKKDHFGKTESITIEQVQTSNEILELIYFNPESDVSFPQILGDEYFQTDQKTNKFCKEHQRKQKNSSSHQHCEGENSETPDLDNACLKLIQALAFLKLGGESLDEVHIKLHQLALKLSTLSSSFKQEISYAKNILAHCSHPHHSTAHANSSRSYANNRHTFMFPARQSASNILQLPQNNDNQFGI